MNLAPVALKAIEFATIRHHGQLRKYTGEPYIVHPLRVAQAVAHLGEPYISVAILHDVLEDTPTTMEELTQTFGIWIAAKVLELTDPPLSAGNRNTRKMLAREQLVTHVAKTVKIADIIDNYPSILEHDPKFAKAFRAEKTLMEPHLLGGDVELFKQMRRLMTD